MASIATIMQIVPLCTVAFQKNFEESAVGKKTVSEINHRNGTCKLYCNTRKKVCNTSCKDKLLLRRAKNKEAAEVSRKKAKLHQNYLEQRLSDLQYEKMKLLLEKEALTRQNVELMRQNSHLKDKMLNSIPLNEESFHGPTFKQAEGMGGFQDFLHSTDINMGCTSSEHNPFALSSNSFHKIEKHEDGQTPSPVSVSPKYVDGEASLSLSEFPCNHWLTSYENNKMNDQIFHSNLLSCENDKSVMEFSENSSQQQILEQESEFLEDFDCVFGKHITEDLLKNTTEVNESSSVLNQNIISSCGEINETFFELPPQWTFDTLFEEMD